MAKKLIDQLEDFISEGNWVGVCSVYNKLTGKNVSPPAQKIAVEDPLTFSKAKLYKFLKETIELGPTKSYTLDDLKDIYSMNMGDPDELDEVVEKIKPIASSSDFTYIPEGKKPLNGDKIRIRPKLTDFKAYDDEDKEPVSRDRAAPTKILAQCKKCGMTDNVNPDIIIAGTNGPTKQYICAKCG